MDTKLLNEIVEKTACGILVVDPQGIVLFANSYAHTMFGYEPDSLVKANIEQLLPVEFRKSHLQHITSFFAKGRAREMGKGNSFPALHADQHIFYISVNLTPSHNGQNVIVTVTETTKHHQREEGLTSEKNQLSADKERLQLLSQQSNSALFITDDTLKITWANEAFSRLIELSDANYPTILDLAGRNTGLTELGRIQQAMNIKSHYSGELLLYAQSGREFWAIADFQPYQSNQNECGFIGSLTDITEHKQLERNLVETSNLQRAMLNSAPIFLVSTNSAGIITLVNQFATQSLQCHAVDLVGQTTPFELLSKDALLALKEHLNLSPSADTPDLLFALKRAVVLEPMTLDTSFNGSNNHSIEVQLTVTSIAGSNQDDVGLVWLGRNISEQRAAEREVFRINRLLETTGEIARLGAWELDIVNNRLWWSDEVYRIHELPINSEISVDKAIHFYAPEARDTIANAVDKAVKQGRSWDEQLPLITAKGNRIWVRAVGYAEYKNAQPVRLHGAFQDITELKEAEQKALAASAAKSQFLANMSHEIRTPLNGVLGINQLLSKTELSSKQQEYTNLIAASGTNLLSIIDDILDVSKIEAGKLTITEQTLELQPLIMNIVDNTRAQIKERQQPVRVEYHIDDELPAAIRTDPVRIRQIIMNLISNALKCTDMGVISLNVEHNDNDILFSVSDTGIGIPEDAISTLFDKFTQVDGSSTRSRGGTGLGLSICKELAVLLGGNITVESQLGKGSTFTLHIPLKAGLGNSVHQHTINLLLLCNEPTVIAQWQELALSHPLNLTVLNSAPQAIQWIKVQIADNNHFSMVIYQTLEGMAGVELIKTLSHKGLLQTESCIFIDDDDMVSNNAICNELGIRHCFNSGTPLVDILRTLDSSEQPHSLDDAAHSALSHMRVLLVEDNPINQVVATEMLTQLGVQHALAVNGRQALEQLITDIDTFDAILMDCQMPEMDGFEATSRIRQMDVEKALTIPIIALTANARQEDIQACLACGMNAHLAKPILFEELKRALEQAMQPVNHYDI
ncbi:PAS domain-containing hybrid sensor histidine kinase/response regulator [Alteromonas facilis]|uniref:PAS domain-containing hybrid sensor histidine kinase/response regulator n=1 Tax=Alteromonas facilis TaxID=2048004 RepID=UPI000C28E464|nr:PAS domain-containing hybrid sensor histidine kinase/response regulator [Alteromonas facilis]